jgi:hypothetical protein
MAVGLSTGRPYSGGAQLPDGTLGSRAPARVAVDPDAIAILPFRVAATRISYLSDGMAELLPGEFTGDLGPKAIDAATVLSAWEKARGRRAHLTQAEAAQVAREVGAGLMLWGGVVASPSSDRVTITASIVNTRTVRQTVAPVVVEGTADSVTRLVSRLSAGLLSRDEGAWKLSANEPGSMNPEALRAFISGRNGFRRGLPESAAEFDRALDLDSSFVLAAYWRTVMQGLEFPGQPPAARVFRIAWDQRSRLSAEQRLVLEAILGPNGPLRSSSRAAMHDAIERVARISRGAAAPHLLGENLLHYGALIGQANWLPRARAAFTKAYALDSTIRSTVAHLVDLAIADGNRDELTRWIRRLPPRQDDINDTWRRYAAAVVAGNPRDIRAARERLARADGRPSFAAAMTTIPRREMDSLIARMMVLSPDQRARANHLLFAHQVLENSGRPSRVAELNDPSITFGDRDDDISALIAMPDDTVALTRLSAAIQHRGSSMQANVAWRAHCELALARLRLGDTTDLRAMLERSRELAARDTIRDSSLREAKVCAELASAIAVALRPGAGAAELVRADSMMRFKVWTTRTLDMNPHWNYDLALAFARQRQWKSAAAAARRRLFGRPGRLAVMLRDEGRWATLAGDTTAAIHAFRQFLVLRELAEPPYAAERDSIKAELARLERPGAATRR